MFGPESSGPDNGLQIPPSAVTQSTQRPRQCPERCKCAASEPLRARQVPMFRWESTLIPTEDAARRRLLKMRRIILGAAKNIESTLQSDGYRYRVGFVTLTYANDGECEPGEFKELVRHYRLWAKRPGEPFRCAWVAELTKRGRVHYHLCFWLRRGLTPPKPDKQGWWNKGMTNVQWARRPVGYLVKYTSKGLDGPVSGIWCWRIRRRRSTTNSLNGLQMGSGNLSIPRAKEVPSESLRPAPASSP